MKDVDPVTKRPLFLLARMGKSCDLGVIYDLLRKHSDHHIEMLENENWYKYVTPKKNFKKKRK